MVEKRDTGSGTGGRNEPAPDVVLLAQSHTDAVIAELARLATGAQSDSVKVAAIKELLDRAWGRVAQSSPSDRDNFEAFIRGLKAELVAKLDRLTRRRRHRAA